MATNWFHKICGKKQQYETKELAEQAAKRCTLKFKRIISSYKCQYCGQWHNGNQQKKRK
jgi:hypothetical protein